MASTESLIVRLGKQMADMAREIVAEGLRPTRTSDQYRVSSSDGRLVMKHTPCGAIIHGDDKADANEVELVTLLRIVAAHHCPLAKPEEAIERQE